MFQLIVLELKNVDMQTNLFKGKLKKEKYRKAAAR